MHPSHLAIPFLLSLAAPAVAQNGPTGGLTREQMWPAPTAEDWAKPVRIVFQRSFEDAETVSKETGKAILVCVNMDGEIASEHYAGIRYRQPEIAKLYVPYVCVIASVYRHNPRDYTSAGERILCPRFGSVTCGEHITMEPIVYDRFLDDRRIAPRHIAVELDGKEIYDVFYAWDTDSVFAAIREGIENRPTPPEVLPRDRSLPDRVASRDLADRDAVEAAYRGGDRAIRLALLEAAAAQIQAAPIDLLRLGLADPDFELNTLAREALARADAPQAVDLITDTLGQLLEPAERQTLIDALVRIGASSPRARMLGAVHQGLAERSGAIDVEGWNRALEGGSSYAPAAGWSALGAELDANSKLARALPDSADARLALAESFLAMAVDPETVELRSSNPRARSQHARLTLEDAQRTAREAEGLGASGWRVDAVQAIAAHYLGQPEKAQARAEAAVRALPTGAEGWNAMAVLAIFAGARQQAIATAVAAKEEWPPEWMSDVHATYSVLSHHPLCSDAQVTAHYDFLLGVAAKAPAEAVLDDGLRRFPDSWDLHERLRRAILARDGLDGLEPAYAARLAAADAPANLEWFTGYASLVTAGFHRRAGRYANARAAYDRAIAHYEQGILDNPATRENSDHYVALALAGRAHVAFEAADYARAVDDLLASFARKPDAAASHDGLGFSPVSTAKLLRARLLEAEATELAGRLQAALDALDPALLELPAYETIDVRPSERFRGRRPRQDR
ncbi:MAG TPA: hypothetical protein VGC54_10705 [Planctomycetota bacterium]